MKRRGIKLGRGLVRLWCRVLRHGRRRIRAAYLPSSPPRRIDVITTSAVVSRLFDWGRSLSRRLCLRSPPRPLLADRVPLLALEEEEGPPPKGYLAVYVGKGEQWQAPRRYVVPVIYFNHPLFGELLREAEEEFGFHHPRGITIPCPAAKFEHIRTRIAATGGCLHVRRKGSGPSLGLSSFGKA
ncbi:hypothetical protein Cni_G19315 [Canna indica]|uniref:Uncharacterized protein n=1 Tax=Canna indica TaxID=4628 RepID=A0AAQ3KKH1_9LILI|nr:hypothetical protein Cni_G19315 [Canna indica]